MRGLAILVAVAAALWGGWWFVGARTAERQMLAAIEAARMAGWRVDYDDLSVRGFPNRFDTTVTAPEIAGPGGAYGWRAPFVQIFALSYRPDRIIAVSANEARLETPAGPVAVTMEDLRASADVTLSSQPEVESATLTVESLRAAGELWTASLGAGLIAMRGGAAPEARDLAMRLDNLELGGGLRAAIDPSGALPAAIDRIDLDAALTLPAPDAFAAVDIRQAGLVWGGMRLGARGDLRLRHDGVPDGTLTIDVLDWKAALALLEGLGAIPAGQLPLISAGLAGMEEADGRITFDLIFAGGQMRLGVIPLGPAPRLPGF